MNLERLIMAKNSPIFLSPHFTLEKNFSQMNQTIEIFSSPKTMFTFFLKSPLFWSFQMKNKTIQITVTNFPQITDMKTTPDCRNSAFAFFFPPKVSHSTFLINWTTFQLYDIRIFYIYATSLLMLKTLWGRTRASRYVAIPTSSCKSLPDEALSWQMRCNKSAT